MMMKILLYLWSLPQNLLGLLLRAIYKGNDSQYEDALVRRSVKMGGGISLGRYIIINRYASRKTIMHEYGHCRQSKRLGPLYLLVIGLPSILHAWRYDKKTGKSYYDYWTERWADRLGGIER
jgi:hypothetical protein